MTGGDSGRGAAVSDVMNCNNKEKAAADDTQSSGVRGN